MDYMKDYYRTSEVAKILDVSSVTVWRWCRDGKLKTVELPSGRRVIPRGEIEQFVRPTEQKENGVRNG